VVEGESRRVAARRLPDVTVGVLAASGALVVVGEMSSVWADRLDATLSSRLQDELLDRLHERDRLTADCTQLEQQSEALLGLARRRITVLQARRALTALAPLIEAREPQQRMHVEQLWLSAAEAGRSGVLSLTLHVDPSLDAGLAGRLAAVLRPDFGEVDVTGPEPAPAAGLSRWTVEIALP
jgi:hypothetical protein